MLCQQGGQSTHQEHWRDPAEYMPEGNPESAGNKPQLIFADCRLLEFMLNHASTMSRLQTFNHALLLPFMRAFECLQILLALNSLGMTRSKGLGSVANKLGFPGTGLMQVKPNLIPHLHTYLQEGANCPGKKHTSSNFTVEVDLHSMNLGCIHHEATMQTNLHHVHFIKFVIYYPRISRVSLKVEA